jgi:hypothetical protein
MLLLYFKFLKTLRSLVFSSLRIVDRLHGASYMAIRLHLNINYPLLFRYHC